MARRRIKRAEQNADISASTRWPAAGKVKPGRLPVHHEAWTLSACSPGSAVPVVAAFSEGSTRIYVKAPLLSGPETPSQA